MLKQSIIRPAVAVFLVFLGIYSHIQLRKVYDPSFPPLREMIVLDDKLALQDITLIVSGFRAVAADLAWIQLLQYIGGANVLDFSERDQKFERLKPLTQRVVRIDPYFVKAYLFGATLLGWVKIINRPEEAVDVLQEGIRNNPSYWPFHSFIIGIGYQKSNQIDKMVAALGNTVYRPDCPLLVKAVLANTYKLNKRYAEALALWEILAESNDPAYTSRAARQIEELHRLINHPS